MTHIKIDSSFVFIHLQMFILFEHFHFNTSEFVFAFFGQQAEVHRTVEIRHLFCRSAEVNGTKTKSLR